MSSVSETYAYKQYSKLGLTMVVLCSMAGVLIQTMDGTIANVALPYMQGSLSASRDQITWVLTSYIVAAAVMTAPAGWLATRFGKKKIMLYALIGFTVSSALCGMATNLGQIVFFRLLQGMFGAALGPLSQAIMFDLYPPEKRGQAMAIWGMGVMIGPILGPTIGGFLTEYYTWRWCFYVNVPVGILTIAGLWIFFKDDRADSTLKFDWLGFAVLSLGVAGFQMMLDRGTDQDWFTSTEIIAETVLSLLGIYLFVVHMVLAEKPFVPRKLFMDRNFVSCLIIMYIVCLVLLASLALMPPFLQTMTGRPVLDAGLVMAPRGFGVIVAMITVGRLANFVDPRIFLTIGSTMFAVASWQMAHWTPSISAGSFIFTTIIQGFGTGMIFTPLNLVAFATLPGEIRNSATSFMNLVRNLGSAVGVSISTVILSNSTQRLHAHLSSYITDLNPMLHVNALSLFMNPHLPSDVATINQWVAVRASILAYQNDYKFMFWCGLVIFPLVWILKRPAFSMSGHKKRKP